MSRAIEQLWLEEAEARYADFVAGKTKAVDGDEVFARARARMRADEVSEAERVAAADAVRSRR